MITSDHIHRIGGYLIRAGVVAILAPLTLITVLAMGNPLVGLLAVTPALLAIAVIMFAYKRLPISALPVAAASLATTVLVGSVGPVTSPAVWMAETGGLLIVTLWTVRLWDAKWGPLATGALVAALLLLLPIRHATTGSVTSVLALVILTMFGLAIAILWGVYLRSIDVRRHRVLASVQRNERLELARDLHDFVAHHVTGIVVQAQAAQYIPADDHQKTVESFAAIESAGLEALTSMRRLVGVMRDEDAGPGSRPLGDLDQLRNLIEQFRVGDVYASLHIAADLSADRLPPEITATAFRIVQEALTNVRKHGNQVTTVTVSIARGGDGVDVTVRDNGRPSTHRSRLAGLGGGYGLAGLSERLTALGGSLAAGNRPEGGWEVLARIPLTGAPSAGSATSSVNKGLS